jgi:D-alanyl-D-alanine endopeptidase (penicillin-binding protein 7)
MLLAVSALNPMRTLVFCAIAGVYASQAWADPLPDIKSRAAVVLDAATGEEIFGKDADEIRPIASTTKIFVAMAVRKRLDLDSWTEITKVDAHYARGGARTRLDIGQKFRNKDLLRAMLIASDNRAATALGRAAGMSPDELVDAMTAVARRLHLKRTRLTDPTGLRGNVSTAREMAIALRAALEDDTLRAIMRQDTADVVSKDHYARIHYGTTNQPLVAGRWDVIGGKTGYTTAAGYCFITGARFDNREVVMAFLGADGKHTRFGDFNRVAAWIDRGAPGAKTVARRTRHAQPARNDTRTRVASPDEPSSSRDATADP